MRLFDLHCDTIYELYHRGHSLKRNQLHVDLDRASRFSPWIQVFAVWIPDDCTGDAAWQRGEAMLQFARRLFWGDRDRIALSINAKQMQHAVDSGRHVAWLSVENGAILGGRLERVQTLFDRGVRILTLTWNGENELGNGCFSPRDDGLTAFGKAVVDEMVRLGMLIDVSHLNARGFDDVANRTSAPFLATHSVSRAVHPHPRNLTDEQFAAIRDRGGLVGLNLCAAQLGEASFERVYRHVAHFWDLDGEHTLALGCDLDGTALPREWDGIAVLEQIGDFFTRKNLSLSQIDRLFFKNAHDFFTRFDTDQKV